MSALAMRILMLSDLYPPAMGGLERHVHDLSHELAARGHEVSVATLRTNPFSPAFEQQGRVRIHRLSGSLQRLPILYSDAQRPYTPPAADPLLAWGLARVVAQERPSIVHAHSWLVHSFLPIRMLSAARLVMTLHDYNLSCPKKTLLRDGRVCAGPSLTGCLSCAAAHYGLPKGVVTTMAARRAQKASLRGVDMFLPVSKAVADGSDLERSHAAYEVIPNFISDSQPRPSESLHPYLSQLPASRYIMFAGTLAKHKGIEVLLRAYAALTGAPPLVLIGSGTDVPAELPPNVTVLRDWPRHAVLEAWERCLFAVMPSIWADPCPTVALEAMAAGKAVLGSKLGGLTDIVQDGVTGLLTAPGNVAELSAAIQRLCQEPELRERLGLEASRQVRRFKASSVVPRIERVYQELLAA